MKYKQALDQILDRATGAGSFILDNLSGGRLGYPAFPSQAENVNPGDTVNIVFAGASTGKGWYRQDQIAALDRPGVHHQIFRWRDLDQARKFVRSLPQNVKFHIAGYSQGAQSANQLARQLKAPVDLIAPITRNYKQKVDWARVWEPANNSPFYSINNFVGFLGGTVPNSETKADRLCTYQGQHCYGVGEALRKAFADQGRQPTEKELEKERNKSQLYRKVFRYLPVGIGIGGGIAGISLAKYLGIRNLFLRATVGGINGIALYGLSKYVMNKLQKESI